jgi:hypothetical protein
MQCTGLTALEMLTISSKSSDSCLCLPEVSTMMTSNRSGKEAMHSSPCGISSNAQCSSHNRQPRLTFSELFNAQSSDGHWVSLGVRSKERDLGFRRVPVIPSARVYQPLKQPTR